MTDPNIHTHWLENCPTLADDTTASVLTDWIEQSGPGEAVIYHRGFLGDHIDPVAPEVLARAYRAAELCQAGVCTLVQRRHGERDFTYAAIRL